MTDIVERLRFSHAIMLADGKLYLTEAALKDMKEAADEIERLRKVLEIEGLGCKVQADITRLKADIKWVREALQIEINERDAARAEIKHLEADKRALAYQVDHFLAECERTLLLANKHEAEIKRLIGLLEPLKMDTLR